MLVGSPGVLAPRFSGKGETEQQCQGSPVGRQIGAETRSCGGVNYADNWRNSVVCFPWRRGLSSSVGLISQHLRVYGREASAHRR